MLWVPKKGKLLRESNVGSVGSVTLGTAVTTGGTSTTKGSVTQLIASTSFDSYWMRICASGYGASTTSSACCVDIMAGAATERVLIANLLAGFCGSLGTVNRGPKWWEFPLYVPSGTRISAQAAGERVATAINIGIFLYGGDGSPPWRVGSKVTTYGVTVPDGTSITIGASGVEGAWTQIASSTSEDHFAIVPSLQILSPDTSVGDRILTADVGIGAAAAEVEIGGPYIWELDSTERMSGSTGALPVMQDIASGSRLTMRVSGSIANNEVGAGALHCVS